MGYGIKCDCAAPHAETWREMEDAHRQEKTHESDFIHAYCLGISF